MHQVRVTRPATGGALKVMPQARVVRATTQSAPVDGWVEALRGAMGGAWGRNSLQEVDDMSRLDVGHRHVPKPRIDVNRERAAPLRHCLRRQGAPTRRNRCLCGLGKGRHRNRPAPGRERVEEG